MVFLSDLCADFATFAVKIFSCGVQIYPPKLSELQLECIAN
jgi:hypothetical protein